MHLRYILLVLALLAAGCELKAPTGEPAGGMPEESFNANLHKDKQQFLIDSEKSRILVYVYRAGALARLGHNHIVLIKDIQGKAWRGLEPNDPAFHFTLKVASFVLDPPALRKTAGEDFSSQPNQEDIDGTRQNMLGERVLNAAAYPIIEVWSENIESDATAATALLTIVIRQQRYQIQAPFHIENKDSQMISAQGRLTLKQSSMGLEPFNILMGAIAVQDDLEIHYHLVARAANDL